MPKNNLSESDVEAMVYGEKEAEIIRNIQRTVVSKTYVIDFDTKQGHGFEKINFNN